MKKRKLHLVSEGKTPEDTEKEVKDVVASVGGEINGVRIERDAEGRILGHVPAGVLSHGGEQTAVLVNPDGSHGKGRAWSAAWGVMFPDAEADARKSKEKSDAKEKVEAEAEAEELELQRQQQEQQFMEDEPLLSRLGFGVDEILPEIFDKVKGNLNKYFEIYDVKYDDE